MELPKYNLKTGIPSDVENSSLEALMANTLTATNTAFYRDMFMESSREGWSTACAACGCQETMIEQDYGSIEFIIYGAGEGGTDVAGSFSSAVEWFESVEMADRPQPNEYKAWKQTTLNGSGVLETRTYIMFGVHNTEDPNDTNFMGPMLVYVNPSKVAVMYMGDFFESQAWFTDESYIGQLDRNGFNTAANGSYTGTVTTLEDHTAISTIGTVTSVLTLPYDGLSLPHLW